MNSLPLVTICIPTFNAEKTVGRTIESILKQDYKNICLKIYDNQSVDNTVKIVQEFQKENPQIFLIINSKNIGGEANFTKCLMGGEGKYTAIFHSDDIYHPTIISEQVKIMEADNAVGGVAVNAIEIDMDEKKLKERFLPTEIKKDKIAYLSYNELLRLTLKYGNFITCPSVLVRTELYQKKIINWNGRDFLTSADLDTWLRLSQAGKMAIISRPLMSYRVAEASYSYNLKKVRIKRHDLFLVLNEHIKQIELTKKDKRNFDFLLFKDNSLITYNLLRSKKYDQLPKLSPLKLDILLSGIQDFWHLKYLVIGTAIAFIGRLSFFYKRVDCK